MGIRIDQFFFWRTVLSVCFMLHTAFAEGQGLPRILSARLIRKPAEVLQQPGGRGRVRGESENPGSRRWFQLIVEFLAALAVGLRQMHRQGPAGPQLLQQPVGVAAAQMMGSPGFLPVGRKKGGFTDQQFKPKMKSLFNDGINKFPKETRESLEKGIEWRRIQELYSKNDITIAENVKPGDVRQGQIGD